MSKPEYGLDAPGVFFKILIAGVVCVALGVFLPEVLHLGSVELHGRGMFLGTGTMLLVEFCGWWLYVKVGKFRHRDQMLAMRAWCGDEQVLDVGCGRGLLLAGAAKRLQAGGHGTGLDVWSNEDMGGNSAAATEQNLLLEGLTERTTLVSGDARAMPFADGSFDVVVSNLCLHNIHGCGERAKAVREIVRVLRPGGEALISDFRHTGEYARAFRERGLDVTTHWGNVVLTFPPLRVVRARKR